MKHVELVKKSKSSTHWTRLAAAGLFAVAALAGCGGGSNNNDVTPPPVTPTGPTVSVPTGTKLTLTASTPPEVFAALAPVVPEVKVAINSAPVVAFSLTNANGNPIVGYGSTSKSATALYASYPNLAFSLAKLVPGTGTAPSKWVNYIVTTVPTTRVQRIRPLSRRPTRPSTDNTGTLVDNGNGTYTYTFFRDITKAKAAVDASVDSGNNKKADLGDLTYDPNAVHRLTIQLSGNAPGTGTNTPTGANSGVTAVPMTKPLDVIYDFIPATGKAVTAADPSRDITSTVKCNECHTKLGGIPGDTSANSGAGFHGGITQ